MRSLRLVLVAATLAAGACGGDGSTSPTIDVLLETPAGGDPLARGDFDTLEIEVRQGEAEPLVLEEPVASGTFDFGVLFQPVTDRLQIRAHLVGASDELIGAPPPFVPFESLTVRVPMGVPGSCGLVAGATLADAVEHPALVGVRTFAAGVGGVGAEEVTRGSLVDLLQLAPAGASDLGVAFGRARAAAYTPERFVILSEGQPPTALAFGTADADGPEALPLHAGAGPASALVALGAAGAAVVGGEDGGAPVSTVSWVGPDGIARETTLATPRAGAAAAPFAGGVLVAGGRQADAPTLELARPGAPTAAVLLEAPGGVRDGGQLFVDDAGAVALLLGGADELGDPRSDTVLFVGCPDACEAREGPAWDGARGGIGVATEARLLVGGDGPSDRVERVVFEGDTARFEPAGTLSTPRRSPGVLVLDSGLAYVAGGAGTDGPRDTIEVCFPAVLTPTAPLP